MFIRIEGNACSQLQEAVHETVDVIFEDPGVQELLVKLYQKGILWNFVEE